MCTAKTLYQDELNAGVYEVSNGDAGALVNNPKLIHDYTSDMLELIWHAVESGNDDVRVELITLLANLNVASASAAVSRLMITASPKVADACRAFQETVSANKAKADIYMGAVESGNGTEYSDAIRGMMSLMPEEHAANLGRVCRDSDGQRSKDAEVLLRMMMVRNPHLDLGGSFRDN